MLDYCLSYHLPKHSMIILARYHFPFDIELLLPSSIPWIHFTSHPMSSQPTGSMRVRLPCILTFAMIACSFQLSIGFFDHLEIFPDIWSLHVFYGQLTNLRSLKHLHRTKLVTTGAAALRTLVLLVINPIPQDRKQKKKTCKQYDPRTQCKEENYKRLVIKVIRQAGTK